MGILDDLKPQPRKPRPTELTAAREQLEIVWDDGRRSELPFVMLRQRCPCAGCVDEWTGRRTLDPTSVPKDIRPVSIVEVGRYAVQIEWSDGHGSGIYSWELLRRLADEHRAQNADA